MSGSNAHRQLHAVAAVLAAVALATTSAPAARAQRSATRQAAAARAPRPATPIEHVVVIFQENVSFDHYFGTYPRAENRPGEPRFVAAPGTPPVNGIPAALLAHNPNAAPLIRLDRAHARTCDQNHGYTAEQRAYHAGLLDRFVQVNGQKGGTAMETCTVMAYFDGNTVTALWRYAQRFAMSDDFFGTTFGPSSPGAINLISGQTHGATPDSLVNAKRGLDLVANGTMVGDPQPAYDDCAAPSDHVSMSGRNVGDLLNARGVTWGWFQGGFRPSERAADGTPKCATTHTGSAGAPFPDYLPHHQPFQFYRSTANPHHLPPSSDAMIGRGDQANHQYDIADFDRALRTGHLPAVVFLKAPAYEDGHAGYSDPVAEQRFLVRVINTLQRSPYWAHLAVFIAYDDSDGWYDHVMPPIVNPSHDLGRDGLTAEGCGTAEPMGGAQDRCGYGPRLPFLVISPYARRNYVDHAVLDQSSILRFIEDNWHLGRIGDGSFDAIAGTLDGLFDFAHPRATPLILDPESGEPARAGR